MRPSAWLFVSFIAACAPAAASPASAAAGTLVNDVRALAPELTALYQDLHANPELSLAEARTAKTLAARLRALGIEVTEGVGGHGVVGVLRNGDGPVVLLRTDMDALPLEENTGLAFASRAKGRDKSGREVPVMHACGHDVHMTAWVGAASILARRRDLWRGTVLFMGQPAEELGTGAKAMIAAGLLQRFGKVTFAVGIHDSADLPAGTVAVRPGFVFANVDSVDLTLRGKGAHGAAPHLAVDPVVLAARVVLGLQTLVSRENDPRDPAVITVGSIHGGTKHNIIPDDVHLQLTVRSYKDDVRARLLGGIERIAKAEALSARAPSPTMAVSESLNATYNDPALTARVAGALRRGLGDARVIEGQPDMVAEDFGELAKAGVPSVMFRVGAMAPAKLAERAAQGLPPPSLHSATFAPDPGPTLETAVLAEVLALLELLPVARSR